MLLGICFLLVLFIVGLVLIRSYASKQKQQESSQAVSEGPEALCAIYEDPDAALQNIEIETADNVVYSLKPQVLGDKEIDAQENVAYCATSRIT